MTHTQTHPKQRIFGLRNLLIISIHYFLLCWLSMSYGEKKFAL